MKNLLLLVGSILAIITLVAVNYPSDTPQCTSPMDTKSTPLIAANFDFVNAIGIKPIDLQLRVSSRFNNTVTLEQLLTAQQLEDVLPDNTTYWIAGVQTTSIQTLQGIEPDIEIFGRSRQLNNAQLDLLKNVRYSDNICVRAKYLDSRTDTDNELVYYITVVPEQEAVCAEGEDALIEYLNTTNHFTTEDLALNDMRPGKVSFTITATGEISNVNLESTSGSEEIDATVINAIHEMPLKWTPAKSSSGAHVDQTLFVSFGSVGC